MSTTRVYIAGPMKGIPLFNFPAFDEAERFINDEWNNSVAINPAGIDREHGFDPETLHKDWDWSVIPAEAGTREEIMRRDISALLTCDAIYMLPGWENSAGAKAELHLARWAGLKIYHHSNAVKPHRHEIHRQPGPHSEDYVDPPKNRAVKDLNPKDNVGSKKPGLSAIPCGPLYEAGAALHYGGLKYGRGNWRAIGVRASVYYDAALRHIMAWWEGEDTDPDSGLPHLAHVIAGLMVYRDSEIIGNHTDDRPISTGSPSARIDKQVATLTDRFPNPAAPYTQAGK